MKLFLLPILACFIFLVISSKANAETIRIATGEYPPFLSEKLKHNGVGLRIIKEAFELEGITVEYGFFTWARAYDNVKNGSWDASATWSHKPARDNDVYFSNALYQSNYAFFHLKTYEFDWLSLDDLKGIKIGATLSLTYTPEFYKAAEQGKLTVDFAKSDLVNLKKLLSGRFEIFPMNIDVAYSLLANEFTKQEMELITHHTHPFSSMPTFLVFSKKSPRSQHLIEVFNRGLKKLRDSGKIEQYFEESRRGEYTKKW